MTNIPLVASAISTHLEETASIITKLAIADPGGQDISKLATQATTLQENISTQTTSIALTRNRVTELGDQLHDAYRALFETSIRILEQVLHGSIARGTRARAEHLAVVAKGMELKLQIMAQTDSMLTDPALQSELEVYRERLESLADDLSGKISLSERTLGEYGRAGKGMLEIAKRYVEVKKECDAVRDEIEKLESRKSDVD